MTRHPGAERAAGPRLASISLALALLTAAAYWPLKDAGFAGFDVEDYVTANPQVLDGISRHGVAWAFTKSHAANWHPLTWLSHMADVQVFGLDPRGHHAVNLLLHLANTLLLFHVLRRLTGVAGRSAFVAALFAVHPLHVESVAWVAERKDTLSTLLWLATTGAYLRYVERPAPVRFIPVLALYVLGLLAKPMLVTLPLVLLLLDFWPLDRLRRAALPPRPGQPPPAGPGLRALVLEKAPLLALALAAGTVTYAVQAAWGAVRGPDQHTLAERFSNAVVSYAAYAWKALHPRDLSAYYPFAEKMPAWQPLLGSLLLALTTAMAISQRRRHPGLTTGWLWYAVTLLPVIGIVQVGSQAMADRYTYVPLTGLLIAAAWVAPELASRRGPAARLLPAAAIAVIGVCVAMTMRQAGYWRDDVTLFGHATRAVDGNWKASLNLGNALQRRGRFAEAEAHYAAAARIRPEYARAHATPGSPGLDRPAPAAAAGRASAFESYRRGATLLSQARAADAAAHFREGLEVQPDSIDLLEGLGEALLRLGMTGEAVVFFEKARAAAPGDPRPPYHLGVAMSRLGRTAEAVSDFRESLRLQPDHARTHNDLGAELIKLEQAPEALRHFEEAARLSPADLPPLFNAATALQQLGQAARAIEVLARAVDVAPGSAEARRRLAGALERAGRREEALRHYREAARIDAPPVPP